MPLVFNHLKTRFKLRVNNILKQRSALRADKSSDARGYLAVLYLIVATPIAVLMSIPLLIRRLRSSTLNLVVLGVPGNSRSSCSTWRLCELKIIEEREEKLCWYFRDGVR